MNEKEEFRDLSFLLSAAAAWLLCAVVLLSLGTLLANGTGMGEQGIAYLSSALSFLCAAAAGRSAARRRKSSALSTALLSATALVILLLTVGFLIKGESMDPSSILSLVSFTYAGVLLGTTLLYHPGNRRKKPLPYKN